MKIEINLAPREEKNLLKRMLDLYLYDLSEYDESNQNKTREVEYPYLDHYWTESERHPFIIFIDGKPGGFVLVNQFGHTDGIDHSIAEFCILKQYRRKGIGRSVAFDIFSRLPGQWEVRTLRENKKAETFWTKVISDYSNGDIKQLKNGTENWDGAIWTFESKGLQKSGG